MHKTNATFERFVHNGPVHARDQILKEGDGCGTPLGRVGRVVDVVRGDVGQVGGRGVLEDVELLDEIEEDGVLLAGSGGLWWAERCGWVVVGCWGCEGTWESSKSEGKED